MDLEMEEVDCPICEGSKGEPLHLKDLFEWSGALLSIHLFNQDPPRSLFVSIKTPRKRVSD
jgi:hypothetical protein